MKKNLKPYAYKQSEHNIEVRGSRFEVRVRVKSYGLKKPKRNARESNIEFRISNFEKCDGVLFVERTGELHLAGKVKA